MLGCYLGERLAAGLLLHVHPLPAGRRCRRVRVRGGRAGSINVGRKQLVVQDLPGRADGGTGQ